MAEIRNYKYCNGCGKKFPCSWVGPHVTCPVTGRVESLIKHTGLVHKPLYNKYSSSSHLPVVD